MTARKRFCETLWLSILLQLSSLREDFLTGWVLLSQFVKKHYKFYHILSQEKFSVGNLPPLQTQYP